MTDAFLPYGPIIRPTVSKVYAIRYKTGHVEDGSPVLADGFAYFDKRAGMEGRFGRPHFFAASANDDRRSTEYRYYDAAVTHWKAV